MKKTVSVVLALVLAFVALFTVCTVAFAVEHEDERDVTTAAPVTTTAAPVTTTAAPVTTTTPPTTKTPDVTVADDDPIVTNPQGVTAIVDDPVTTKKASKVTSSIPSTGNAAFVPAVAVLALLAGTVAVVKTKKDN